MPMPDKLEFESADDLANALRAAGYEHAPLAEEEIVSAAPQCDAADWDPFFDAFPPEMLELRNQIGRVVPQDTTLLLTGETGTGKTRLARLIHELSPRRKEPFLIVDCGALSPNLIESEMFGHVKGAFTGANGDRPGKFAAAGRGTLLLDEINSLPLNLQSRLLRAVDDRAFRPVGSNRDLPLQARIIAATNAPLDQEVAAGRFRADLYYRLEVVNFHLPPLRQRREMVGDLAEKFLAEFSGRNRPEIRGISPQTKRLLRDYHFPGNIRELRNIMERAVALCPGPYVQVEDLPEAVRRKSFEAAAVSLSASALDEPETPGNLTLAKSKEVAEISRIKEALAKHNNNRLRAASELGISRMGLYKKLHKYGLA